MIHEPWNVLLFSSLPFSLHLSEHQNRIFGRNLLEQMFEITGTDWKASVKWYRLVFNHFFEMKQRTLASFECRCMSQVMRCLPRLFYDFHEIMWLVCSHTFAPFHLQQFVFFFLLANSNSNIDEIAVVPSTFCLGCLASIMAHIRFDSPDYRIKSRKTENTDCFAAWPGSMLVFVAFIQI